MLLFNAPTPMHTAWSELGSLIDPESKTGSCGSTFRNFHAFIQPLYNFFKIADGVLSKFHDADAFDAAKGSYCKALETQSLLVAPPVDAYDSLVECLCSR